MRNRLLVSATALFLASCAPSPDVLVTRSAEGEPASATAPTNPADEPPTTRTEPPMQAATAGSAVELLLAAEDLPDWQLSGPMRVPAEPAYVAADCASVNDAWGAAATGGWRSRGSVGPASFRNTVVVYDDEAAASAILNAVDQVPSECPSFLELPDSQWWSEPLPMPAGAARAAGLVVGNESIPSWAIGFWQVGTAVVVLEVDGPEMWSHVDALLATLTARIDGSSLTPTTVPGTRPGGAESTLPVPQPQPAPSTTALEPPPETRPANDTFPPTWEDWTEHRLAPLAPHPSELGAGWIYEYGSVSAAEPANPSDFIDGCDVGAPATLPGISLAYQRAAQDGLQQIEVELGEGPESEIRVLLDTFRAVAECDLSEIGFFDGLRVVDDVTFEGATDSIVLIGSADFSKEFAMSMVIAGAAYEDLVVFVFASTMNDATDVVTLASDVVRTIAANR